MDSDATQVQSEISNFGFEILDSSNFEMSVFPYRFVKYVITLS